MTLEREIAKARKEIVSDGYEMSVGEIINLYRDEEIIINPSFQRLFRWDLSRKTRFIESLLLGIPMPPVFVYQDKAGVWELIDGLQRLSTIFEFVGILRDPDDPKRRKPPSVLDGTRYLPSLSGKMWESNPARSGNDIGRTQQLQIKRARLRVEILKQESDPQAKYELFQRLNTGGASLTEQEVRNCVAVMLNKPLHDWLMKSAKDPSFLNAIDQTEYGLEKQSATELALRFLVFRYLPYKTGLDVHEYLDEGLIRIARDASYDMETETKIFRRTFQILDETMGDKAFKRWNGTTFHGKFLMSVFEVVATGVAKNIDKIEALPKTKKKKFIESRCKELWGNTIFKKNSGAGIRGTTRLANLLPMAKDFFAP